MGSRQLFRTSSQTLIAERNCFWSPRSWPIYHLKLPRPLLHSFVDSRSWGHRLEQPFHLLNNACKVLQNRLPSPNFVMFGHEGGLIIWAHLWDNGWRFHRGWRYTNDAVLGLTCLSSSDKAVYSVVLGGFKSHRNSSGKWRVTVAHLNIRLNQLLKYFMANE